MPSRQLVIIDNLLPTLEIPDDRCSFVVRNSPFFKTRHRGWARQGLRNLTFYSILW